MTTSTFLSTRRGLGGFAALAGGALMIVSVFLPWLSSPLGGDSVSGWDTYDLASGTEQWFVQEAFRNGFSPLFSGMSVLVAGALLALIGLAMMFSLSGGAYRLPAAGILLLALLAVLVFIVGGTNLLSLYATGDPDLVTPEYGLYLLAAGAIVGLLGVLVGIGRGKS
jgi:hypothetical protein